MRKSKVQAGRKMGDKQIDWKGVFMYLADCCDKSNNAIADTAKKYKISRQAVYRKMVTLQLTNPDIGANLNKILSLRKALYRTMAQSC